MGIHIVHCIFKNCLVFCVSSVILKSGKKEHQKTSLNLAGSLFDFDFMLVFIIYTVLKYKLFFS